MMKNCLTYKVNELLGMLLLVKKNQTYLLLMLSEVIMDKLTHGQHHTVKCKNKCS